MMWEQDEAIKIYDSKAHEPQLSFHMPRVRQPAFLLWASTRFLARRVGGPVPFKLLAGNLVWVHCSIRDDSLQVEFHSQADTAAPVPALEASAALEDVCLPCVCPAGHLFVVTQLPMETQLKCVCTQGFLAALLRSAKETQSCPLTAANIDKHGTNTSIIGKIAVYLNTLMVLSVED